MVDHSQEICSQIQTALIDAGLFSQDAQGADGANVWRISPEPFYLSSEQAEFFSQLGHHLVKFYSVANQFYSDSYKGRLPDWFAGYLDQGKPSDLVDFGRMKRFRAHLPGIIRPDVLLTEDGFAVTELDSVPGGFGLTARLMELYRGPGRQLIGDQEGGIPALFYSMIESFAGARNCALAIVVSDEAHDYRSEMDYLAANLRDRGYPVHVVHPREIDFRESGLSIPDGDQWVRLEALYRFFELFDLKNIPKSELLMYSAKKGRIKTTPPYKTYLEEKLLFALFHHPVLSPFWENALGPETFAILSHLIPNTWVLDNRPMPPHGLIPRLMVKGAGVREWSELDNLTQKEREYAVKPSGFSPAAWGSRGVVIGHDVSGADWRRTLKESLARFEVQPSILQEFHKAKRVQTSYMSPMTGKLTRMESRARLTPYYFVVDGIPRLGGILATLCPQDKKKIHGMAEAVMVPCAVKD